ncbi:MAG: hypothetical protein ACXAC5_03905 [Promethearchaeota archaeon]|jgi:hypothetical protein
MKKLVMAAVAFTGLCVASYIMLKYATPESDEYTIYCDLRE